MSRQDRRARRGGGLSRTAVVGGAAAVVLAVTAVAVFALGGGDEPTRTTHKAAPTSTSTTSTTIPVPKAPLTGLPDPDGVANGRSSVAVKIENTPEARPQSGLDVADIVYEEQVEGGITRFWAVFNSNVPENIGPIRSVRSMDPGIVSGFGGVVAYSGGTEPNVALIRAVPGITWVDENNAGDAYFRNRERSAPHNLFAKSALLFQRGGQPVPPRAQYAYLEEGQSFTGEPIAQAHLNFRSGYDNTWVWNPLANSWSRYQRTNEPFLAVGSTPEPVQVTAANVVIQFVPYNGNGEGELFGTGDAWILSNGQLVRGKWARLYANAPTAFYDAAGAPILFTPGRTWVELLPAGSAVDLVPGAPPSTTTTTKPRTTKKRNA